MKNKTQTLAEQLIEHGRKDGIQKGRVEGRAGGRIKGRETGCQEFAVQAVLQALKNQERCPGTVHRTRPPQNTYPPYQAANFLGLPDGPKAVGTHGWAESFRSILRSFR